MKRNRKKLIFIFLVLIIFAAILKQNIRKIVNDEEILKQIYGEPIGEDGTINNSYFGIEINGKNAKDTLTGINQAIAYASKKNIENVKLEKGTYIIDSQRDQKEYHYQEKGITLKSNMEFDLNGSTIKHITNNRESYSLISIIAIDNVTIKNGILEGDRETHDYNNGSTNEFGHGIDIAGGNNVEIKNLEIRNMTGDGIYTTNKQINSKYYNSNNINIHDCDIYNCRRQGISIIVANGVKIYNNQIHNINGTNPQTCIDLETGGKEYKIENVKIFNNQFYSTARNIVLQISKNVIELDVTENEIHGDIRIYNAENELNIIKNKIFDGKIRGVLSTDNLTREQYYVKKVNISGNSLENSSIELSRLNNSIIANNIIQNGKIFIESMNAAVFNNEVINNSDSTEEYAGNYKINEEDQNKYTMFVINNKYSGKFSINEKIENNPKLEVKKDYNQMQNYINKFNEKN